MQNSTLVTRAERAYLAHRSGDYEGTVFLLKRLAADGESAACSVLGTIFEHGRPGVPKDYVEALRWYREAVGRANEPLAHFGIARMNFLGLGTEKNDRIALEHLLKIEHEQQPSAHYLLGMVLLKKTTQEHSLSRAEVSLGKASDLGHLAAKAALARLLIRTGRIRRGLCLLYEASRQIAALDTLDDWRVSLHWIDPALE